MSSYPDNSWSVPSASTSAHYNGFNPEARNRPSLSPSLGRAGPSQGFGPTPGFSGGNKRPREPSPTGSAASSFEININRNIFEAQQDDLDAHLERQASRASSNIGFGQPSQSQNQNYNFGHGQGQQFAPRGPGEYQNKNFQNGREWKEPNFNSTNNNHSNDWRPTTADPFAPNRQNPIPKGDEDFFQNKKESARPELMNFFETSATKPLPVIARPQRNLGEFGAPLPKLPKQAHYNQHKKEDEYLYANELRPLHKAAIPAFDTDSDSDDEDNSCSNSALRVRAINLKEEVFSKYDFGVFNVNNQNLAAFQMREKIVEAIENNRVTIIDGFTGCGKTTQVPQFIIDHHAKLKRPCNVIVTQPRRLAAVSVARRVCEERGWTCGTVVGYQVGMEKNTCADTLVTYMTTGVLLQKLIRLKSLKHWTHIIVDEVHERDLHTDLLLLFMKKILLDDVKGREKHVKLILMSATLDSKKFSEYFPTQKNVNDEMIETPVIKVPTFKRFHIEEFFLDNIMYDSSELDEISSNLDEARATLLPDICNYAVKTIVQFDSMEKEDAEGSSRERYRDRDSKDFKYAKGERGSVLVFLPGLQEIKFLLKSLQDENRRYTDTNGGDPDHYKWDIVPLHSSITNEEQSKVFATPLKFRRKIILSTNIAESSITVPDIVYVIDFCLTKSNCVDPRTNFSCLRTCWASVNQCIQRKGRTGRVRDGKVYRMVPKKFFAKELRQESEPDMLKSALEHVVLQVKTLDMGSPREMLCLALDAPPVSGIERAVANLKEVGAMTVMTTKWNWDTRRHEPIYDTSDGDVTFLGDVMSSLPISPQCSRLIMLGHCFGVLKECIIIAAGLSAKSPFCTPFEKQLESYLQKLKWAKKSYSDCFAILYAYRAWQKRCADMDEYIGANQSFRSEKQWARQRYIQISQLREIRSLVEDIEERLKQKGVVANPIQVDINPDSDDIPKEVALMLKISIAGAFYPNYFHRSRPDTHNYERERSKEVAGNDLFSTVYYRNFPSGHNGTLYAKHVASSLSYGLSVPRVKFEGQKVFCIFDGSGARIGPICEGVYRAIKKRQVRENLEFKLLWKEDEVEEVKRQMDRRDRRTYRRCPPQTTLPSVMTSKINVVVTYAESPSQFWIISNRHIQSQDTLATVINSNLSNVPFNPRKLFVGALVLAQFEQQYFRARIQAINDNVGIEQCLVYFIDYGNSEWVSITTLQDFSPKMLEAKIGHYSVEDLPGVAVECRLSGTKPAVIHGSVWPDAAVKAFKTFVADMRELEMQIFAIDKSVIIGELLELASPNQHEVSRCNFNEWLTNKNFADRAPEPYTATLNYRARTRFDLMKNDKEQIEACNKQQLAELNDLDFLEPPHYGKTPCTLKGPYSPLELDFQSLCNSSSSKQVSVDNYSVNSVILDHEPTAPTSRLLVASSINIQDKSGRVVARETTMMPATPGLLALMALVFAPKAELRTNVEMQRYTGVLCGLGTDPVQNEPIYMDHDMEVVFDTEIDDEDIEMINFIRYDMNVILRENSGANNSSVQKDLLNRIFALVKKPRKSVDEEIWPQESYVWDRIPAACIKPAPRNMFPTQPLDIFQPHATVHLSEMAPSNISWEYAV